MSLIQRVIDRFTKTPIPTMTALKIPKSIAERQLFSCNVERSQAAGIPYKPVVPGERHLCDCNGWYICSWPPEER